jgi:hypothetical protein
MSKIQWVQIIAALIGGGAMGAIITAVVTTYRNKIQPIGRKIQFIPVFNETIGISSLQAQLTISDGQTNRQFDNLFIANVLLINKGNKHFDEFRFGMTLSEKAEAIYVEPQSQDRHHVVTLVNQVYLNFPASEMDFILRPFNRRDVYSFKLFIVIPKDMEKPDKINFSSPHPIRFIDMTSTAEAFIEGFFEGFTEEVESKLIIRRSWLA